MPTLKEVKDQIAKLPSPGRYIFWTEKEVRCLPTILEEGEPILAVTSGFVDKNTWLAVCTDRRVLFIDRGMVYGTKQVQMPLNRINSIDYEIGIAMGSITVGDGSTTFTIGAILRNKVAYFVKVAKQAMEHYNYRMSMHAQQHAQQHPQQYQQPQQAAHPQHMQQPAQQHPQQQPQQPVQQQAAPQPAQTQAAPKLSANEVAEHLEKLAALREKGILTEEEFQAQKARILSQ